LQESVDGAGTDVLEFVSDGIRHMVFFSESDEVKVLPEEGCEQFSAGPVEVFPEQFKHNCGLGAIIGEGSPFFSTILTVTI
jgi:hypothetical protein